MTPSDPGQLEFAELTREDCFALLARQRVGRLAFARKERVDIVPIHYVFRDGRIFFRTAPGTKLLNLAHRPWVALEVDEIDSMSDWRSVVVHGTAYRLEPDGPEVTKRAYADALRALRDVFPATLTDADPVPFRDVVVEITLDSVTGRASRGRAGRKGKSE